MSKIIRSKFTDFKIKAQEKFGNRFGYDGYSWNGMRGDIEITCCVHGVFSWKPYLHLQSKFGCPECARNRNLYNTIDEKEFLRKAKSVHGNRYTYGEYFGFNKPMRMFCEMHGEFSQRPNLHCRGSECPKCGILKSSKTRQGLFATFVSEAQTKHGDQFTYNEQSWGGCDTKIVITCKHHGDFEQKPYEHLTNVHGCPGCAVVELLNGL